MRKNIYKFIISILFISFIFSINESYAQSGWFVQNSGNYNTPNAIFFINQNTGWFVGMHQSIYKTTNGGLNWVVQNTLYIHPLYSIYFIDENTGWAVGSLAIMNTTNGGLNWFTQHSSLTIDFYSVSFVNNYTGWVVGSVSTILKTTNGGLSWISISNSANCTLTSVKFYDQNTGWASGDNKILKSTNGGNNWIIQSVGSVGLMSIDFIDQNTGWDVGTHATIVKTTNGGNNWFFQNYSSNDPMTFFSVYFIDHNTGWVSSNFGIQGGTIMKTTDGGFSWFTQYILNGYGIVSICFIDQNTGWACGGGAGGVIILKTTDGRGPIGIKPISSDIPSHFSLLQNYPNPFNPGTKIKFDVPKLPLTKGARGMLIQLKIYDILGREVTTLVNEQLQPGTYEVDWNASGYPSGVYFYKLVAGDYRETKKMIIMK